MLTTSDSFDLTHLASMLLSSQGPWARRQHHILAATHVIVTGSKLGGPFEAFHYLRSTSFPGIGEWKGAYPDFEAFYKQAVQSNQPAVAKADVRGEGSTGGAKDVKNTEELIRSFEWWLWDIADPRQSSGCVRPSRRVLIAVGDFSSFI